MSHYGHNNSMGLFHSRNSENALTLKFQTEEILDLEL